MSTDRQNQKPYEKKPSPQNPDEQQDQTPKKP